VDVFKPSRDNCSVFIKYAVMIAALQRKKQTKEGTKPLGLDNSGQGF